MRIIKIFLTILILIFSFQSLTNASEVKEFELEGMSVGDSLLDHFNIENIAAEVPKNLETLLELPNCFLGQIQTNKGKELVTVVRKGLDYTLFYPSRKKEKNTELEFLKKPGSSF